MGWIKGLLGGWYESGGVRFKHGASVCIGGAYEWTSRYAGCVGAVVGLGENNFRYHTRFLVDLGGMCIEVPPGDLELAREYPKDAAVSDWEE